MRETRADLMAGARSRPGRNRPIHLTLGEFWTARRLLIGSVGVLAVSAWPRSVPITSTQRMWLGTLLVAQLLALVVALWHSLLGAATAVLLYAVFLVAPFTTSSPSLLFGALWGLGVMTIDGPLLASGILLCTIFVAVSNGASLYRKRPEDLGNWGTLSLALALAVAVGMAVRGRRLGQHTKAAERELTGRLAREDAARHLHGAIAGSLSYLVLRAQQEEQNHVEPSEYRAVLQEFEDVATTALRRTREVIGVLEDTQPAADMDAAESMTAADAQRCLRTIVEDCSVRLERLGFSGVASVDRGPDVRVEPEVPGAVVRLSLEVLEEAFANILRHGDPEASYLVRASIGAGEIVIVARNGCTGQRTSQLPTSGLGLEAVGSRVQLRGGSFRAGRDGAEWVLTTVIPHEPWR